MTGTAPAEAQPRTVVTLVVGPATSDNGTHIAGVEEMLRPVKEERYWGLTMNGTGFGHLKLQNSAFCNDYNSFGGHKRMFFPEKRSFSSSGRFLFH